MIGSASCSQVDLSLSEDKNEDSDMLGEPERLDLSISEKDVLNELEKRLNGENGVTDTGQSAANSSQSFNSSHNSDSYYECILEDSLKEEFVKDATGKLVCMHNTMCLIYNFLY